MTLTDWIELVRHLAVTVGLVLLVRWAGPRLTREPRQLLWSAVVAEVGVTVLATFWDVVDQPAIDVLGLEGSIRAGFVVTTLVIALMITEVAAALYAVAAAARHPVHRIRRPGRGARDTPSSVPPTAVDPASTRPVHAAGAGVDLMRTHLRPSDATHIAPRSSVNPAELTTLRRPDTPPDRTTLRPGAGRGDDPSSGRGDAERTTVRPTEPVADRTTRRPPVGGPGAGGTAPGRRGETAPPVAATPREGRRWTS